MDTDFLRISETEHDSSYREWACLECVATGRALPANLSALNVSMGPVFFCYYDKTKTCAQCKQEFVFSAQEQKLWYEDWGFLTRSTAKHCAACRAKRRERKSLQADLETALRNLEESDYKSIERVAECYVAMGLDERAREFASRARNRRVTQK